MWEKMEMPDRKFQNGGRPQQHVWKQHRAVGVDRFMAIGLGEILGERASTRPKTGVGVVSIPLDNGVNNDPDFFVDPLQCFLECSSSMSLPCLVTMDKKMQVKARSVIRLFSSNQRNPRNPDLAKSTRSGLIEIAHCVQLWYFFRSNQHYWTCGPIAQATQSERQATQHGRFLFPDLYQLATAQQCWYTGWLVWEIPRWESAQSKASGLDQGSELTAVFPARNLPRCTPKPKSGRLPENHEGTTKKETKWNKGVLWRNINSTIFFSFLFFFLPVYILQGWPDS